jgi:type IV secretion system protein VirD4
MTPTRLLVGQIAVVFAIVIGGLWFATQWAASELAYQPRLGEPWFELLSLPVYHPWRLFEWWYARRRRIRDHDELPVVLTRDWTR